MKLIILILAIGIIYRLLLTADGKFLFNLDTGRDMVDVREMVILGKPRLTGPGSAIEGFYNGPAWYYLLAIPFAVSGGDPYASVLMEIVLWAIGGFFLIKLTLRWGVLPALVAGALWISSNYIVLVTLYAFNPNPVTLLMPLFIYLLEKYLKEGKIIYSIGSFLMAGLFFNFEMNFGFILPLVIFVTVLLANKKLLKSISFWLGSLFFIFSLVPQILFDLRHEFIFRKSILKHLESSGINQADYLEKANIVVTKFFDVLSSVLINMPILTFIAFILIVVTLLVLSKKGKWREPEIIIPVLLVILPIASYIFLPVTVNSWHLGGVMVAGILLLSISIAKISQLKELWLIPKVLGVILIVFSFLNIVHFFKEDFRKPSSDPSVFKNEIMSIDYIYQEANGKNFKVYIYMPSIIDYPYQYLIWWYGLKAYGYLPKDYAYAPDKPKYISEKENFSATELELKKREDSNLVFLIKEPDRNNTRHLWENTFKGLELVSSEKIGPNIVEIRKDISQL